MTRTQFDDDATRIRPFPVALTMANSPIDNNAADNKDTADDMSDSSSSVSHAEKIKWFPLESNPELLNQYLARLGLNTSQVCLHDVYSTEDWALSMIPRPVYAVIFLYPLSEKLRQRQYPKSTSTDESSSSPLVYIPQRIGNACGTMAILHATLNAAQPFLLVNSWIDEFRKAVVSLPPLARAELLERDATLATYHDAATRSRHNSTTREQNVDDYDNMETHFVTFVCHNHRLVELDGRKITGGPVDCGLACDPETLLETACHYIQSSIMALDPSEMRFTILALASAAEEAQQAED